MTVTGAASGRDAVTGRTAIVTGGASGIGRATVEALLADGGRVVVGLLPWRLAVQFAQVERFGFFIVMGLVLLGIVNAVWMQPIMSSSMQTIQWLLLPLAGLLQLSAS